MPKATDEDEGLEPIPGFAPLQTREDDELPTGSVLTDTDPDTPSTPTSPGPATNSTPSRPADGASASPGATRGTGSSRGSTDPEVAASLAGLAGGIFMVVGILINKLARRRDDLWHVTQTEQEAFGAAAGRLVAKQIPEELTDGEGAELVEMGVVVAGYAVRNGLGVTASQAEGRQQAAAPAAPAPPPGDQKVPQHFTQAPAGPAAGDVAEPAGPPPSVITPDI